MKSSIRRQADRHRQSNENRQEFSGNTFGGGQTNYNIGSVGKLTVFEDAEDDPAIESLTVKLAGRQKAALLEIASQSGKTASGLIRDAIYFYLQFEPYQVKMTAWSGEILKLVRGLR